jgi:hypothetical protein
MLGAPGWYVRCLSSRADILIHSRIIPFFRARDRPLHRLTFNEAATYSSRKLYSGGVPCSNGISSGLLPRNRNFETARGKVQYRRNRRSP